MARAAALGWQLVSDPAPWLETSGRRVEPQRRGDRLRFALPAGCTEARLHSRASRPRDVSPANGDDRQLGLGLGCLSLCGSDGSWWDVSLDHPALKQGFFRLEHENDRCWRWTDGDAWLTLATPAAGRAVVAIEVALNQEQSYSATPCEVEMTTRHGVPVEVATRDAKVA